MLIPEHLKKMPLATRLERGLALLGIAVFGLVATACGTSNTAAAPIQVRVWRYNQDIDAVRDLIREVQAASPQIQYSYQRKPLANYESTALKSLAAKEGPDIWGIPSDWIGDEQSVLAPLPSNFFYNEEEKISTGPVESAQNLYPAGIVEQILSDDGKQVMGVPTNVDALQLYWNPELFSQALNEFRISLGDNYEDTTYQPVQQLLSRPPITWTELIQQNKYLTKRNGSSIIRSAIAFGTADNTPNAQDVLQLLIMQNGARIVSTDRTKAAIHLEEHTPTGALVYPGQMALDFFTSFSNPNKETYSWNPSMPQAIDAFAQGRVAMVIAYSDFGQELAEAYPQFRPEKAAIPQIGARETEANPFINMIRFSVETVTQTANNQGAAFDFLKRYTSRNYASSLASEQRLHTPYAADLKSQAQNSDDYLARQILNGKSVYKKDRTQFDALFRQMIVDVTQNGVASSKALDSGAQKITNLFIGPVPTPGS